MATNTGAPDGAMSPDATDQLPNCIIASSNRFHDLLPFCNSLYQAEPQKWGCILPWEFPHDCTKDAEEVFLRRYFSEVEIHMQGGAHGVGAGFRFLKQAWLSIALWNYEKRVPSIATWWLSSKENSSVLEDPAMCELLCKAEVTPETFFEPRDIQMYGKSLLGYVVKHIQDVVKTRQLKAMEEPKSTNIMRSASDPVVATDSGVRASHLVASSPSMSHGDQKANSSDGRALRVSPASAPADDFLESIPIPSEKMPGKHRTFISESARPTWNAEYPKSHIQGRKRGGHLGSGGNGNRGGGFDRRSQEYQHRFNSYMGSDNSGFELRPSSLPGPVTGPMIQQNQAPHTYSEFPISMQGVSPAPAYNASMARASRQHTRGSNYPYNEHPPQPAMNPGMFSAGANVNYPVHPRDTARAPSDRSAHSAFNDFSFGSGDVRRSSVGSRGGGLRAYGHNRGGKRGGRARDSGHQATYFSEEGYYPRRPSNDFHSRPNFNSGKRRGSVYQENTWRSGSEHPQVENETPQRVLSMPEQLPAFQDFSGAPGHRQLPPFSFPQPQGLGHQGQFEHPLPTGRLPDQFHSIPDMEVDKKYIGADAKHVTELMAYNIPSQATEEDVAREFSTVCDVEVVGVRFDRSAKVGSENSVKSAFVRFPSHDIARRVLDLREVELYGKPMSVQVPRKMLTEHGMQHSFANHGYRANPNPGAGLNQWPHDYPRALAPPPQFVYPAPMANNQGGFPLETSEPDFASIQPFIPNHSSRGENPLSTVLSSNVTPAASVTNTPKKKNKNKKKNKPHTPRAQTTDDEPSLQARMTKDLPAQETPVKPKRKQQGFRDYAASSNQPSSTGVVSDGKLVSKDMDTPERTEPVASDQEPSGSMTANTSQGPTEVETVGNDPSSSQKSSDTMPKASHRSTPSRAPLYETERDLVAHDKQSHDPNVDKEIESPHFASQGHGEDRHIVDSTPDSDHVDESFHTASASPPMDKQVQTQPTSKKHGKPADARQPNASAAESKKLTSSSQEKNIVIDVSGHAQSSRVDKIAKKQGTVSLNETDQASPRPTTDTPLPISVQAAAPPTIQSAVMPARDEVLHSTSQRSVSDQSVAHKTANVRELRHASTQRVISEDRALGRTESLVKKREGKSQENNAPEIAKQRVVSANSVPETPMTAYHTAPTTPAPVPTTTPEKSNEKPSVQSKTPIKKGPSQTESFSMFGKKQQKQKKQAKGKSTLKGKPLDSADDGSSLASGVPGQNMSGNATPAHSSSVTSSGKKPKLSIETQPESSVAPSLTRGSKKDSKTNETTLSDSTIPAAGGQESPTKGGLRNFFGLFGRVKSPSVSSKDTSLEDVPQQDELTASKSPAAIPEAGFSIDHLLQGSFQDRVEEQAHSDEATNAFTALDHAGDFDGMSEMPVAGLGISTSNNLDLKETPKKKRKKKKSKSASAQQNESSKDSRSNRDGDKDEALSISTSSARADAIDGSYDAESDNRSEQSSTTMGRPTPPVSPIALTPGKRKRIEQRMTEEHIISPPAPRNKHVKKKSYSRTASSATSTPAQESSLTSPSATAPISDVEADQQQRVLKIFHISPRASIGDSGGDGDSRNTGIFLSDLADDGDTQQVHLFHVQPNNLSNLFRILDVLNNRRHDDAGSDDVTVATEAIEAIEDDAQATDATISDRGSPQMEE